MPDAAGGTVGQARAHDAAEQVEALLVRSILKSSGAFTAGAQVGGGAFGDMVLDALAGAVAKDGTLGVATMLAGVPQPLPSPVGVPGRQCVDALHPFHAAQEDVTSGKSAAQSMPSSSPTDPWRALNAYGARADKTARDRR